MGTHVIERIPATAGNAVYTFTAPVGSKWKVSSGQVALNTDATVANRRVVVKLLDSNDVVVNDIHSGATVAASQTNAHHELMQGVYRETAFIANTLQVPIPQDWVIPGGCKLTVSVDAGVAGDSYSGALLLESVY